jgi:hypothetical protein
MTVEVIHSLSSVGFAIDHKTSAVFRASVFGGKFLSLEKQPSEEGGVGGVRLHDIPYVLFGNHQKMHRRLRLKIIKSKKFGVLVYLFCRNLPPDYFAKNTVIHDDSIQKNRNI